MKLLKNIYMVSICFILFALGYLSRDLLNDFLKNLYYTNSVYSQFLLVFNLTFRILTASLALLTSLLFFSLLIFLAIAIFQEMYYQFMHRKVISILSNRLFTTKKAREETMRQKAQRLAKEQRDKLRRESELRASEAHSISRVPRENKASTSQNNSTSNNNTPTNNIPTPGATNAESH